MATQDLSKNSLLYQNIRFENKAFAVVTAHWNKDITHSLKKGCIDTLKEFGVSNIFSYYVPGAFELALGAQLAIEKRQVDAVICLGCVIKGETKHFDFVCESAANGIKDVGLKYNRPVIFGVLTDNNKQQSIDRSGGKLGNKGVEAAYTALNMLALKENFK